MNVTAKLLRLFRVDGQLRGLQTRLLAAERFLAEQSKQLEQVEAKAAAIESQVRQLQASAGNNEGESNRLEARMETIRKQMDSAKTNKEYKAFLTELNTLKVEKDKFEQTALEHMTKIDEFKAQAAALAEQRAERQKMQLVAKTDRDAREAEIRDRVNELKAERIELAKDVPPGALKVYEKLVADRGEAAMAPLEVQDRRRHEFTCGACMMSLPVESAVALMSRGDMMLCSSCGCILYMDEASVQALQPTAGKR